jgi:hypothetical protein
MILDGDYLDRIRAFEHLEDLSGAIVHDLIPLIDIMNYTLKN